MSVGTAVVWRSVHRQLLGLVFTPFHSFFFLLSFFLLSPGLLHSFCFTVGFCVGTVGWKCIIFQILKDIPRMTSLAHLFQQKPVQEVSIALACGVRALGPPGKCDLLCGPRFGQEDASECCMKRLGCCCRLFGD